MRTASPSSFWFSLPIVIFASHLSAQPGQGFGAAMAANAKLLHQYTYKQKTEILYKGEGKVTRIAQVRFTPDGRHDATVLSQTGGEEEATGLGHRIVNKKREELREYGERVTALVEMYLPPDPEKLRTALATAELDASGGLMSLVMKNYLKPGDSFSVLVDPANRKIEKFELKTLLDKDPITVTSDMKALPNGGPTYPGLTKVKAPAKALEIDITQYDFMKL